MYEPAARDYHGRGVFYRAGCAGNQSRTRGVAVTIYNQATVPYSVEIQAFGDGATEGQARVYDTAVDIEAGGEQMREASIEPKRYLIRYHAYEDNSRLTDADHVHYIPDGDGAGTVALDIQETGEVTRR